MSGAEYFDRWYADQAESSAKDALLRRHLGLPDRMRPNSTVPWSGLVGIGHALALVPSAALLDLACGRGCTGLELARRVGARLIGVDFSSVALRHAAAESQHHGVDGRFVVAELTACGLDADSVDAVMCIDSIQFAQPQAAAFAEIHRVLRPGGRVVLTGWEVNNPTDESLPARLRAVGLERDLRSAGFDEIEVQERSDWRAVEMAMWREAAGLDPGDDPALSSLHEEARRALDTEPRLRRVMAVARTW